MKQNGGYDERTHLRQHVTISIIINCRMRAGRKSQDDIYR
jgi:hypothetical protein